ncbi:MAG TPA: DMT family transporter [Rhizomicrobium sp.]|nr:DMT family transporter [Rhizomicrobium sp.]
MKHTSLGIALKLGATVTFSLMYVLIRLVGNVPVGEVVFFRGFFALLPLWAYAQYSHGSALAMVRTAKPWLHLRRSIAGTASMFLNFAAVTRLPLADVTAFSFVMPIFAVVLAALMLGEKVGPHRALAVVIGFGGVLLMVEPHGLGFGLSVAGGSSLGAGFALSGALLSAFVVVFIRHMSTTETSEAIIFYFMAVCAAAGAVTMLWSRAPLSLEQATLLVMCGVMGGIGQLCMTYAYRYAEPSLLAPFDYVAMVWAVLLGYFIFAEIPERIVLAGAGVVIASGLYIVWRERGRAIASSSAMSAAPK